MFSPVSSYLPWLLHSVLFPNTRLPSSPCFLWFFACLSLLAFLTCLPLWCAVSRSFSLQSFNINLFSCQASLHRAHSPVGTKAFHEGDSGMSVKREMLGLQEHWQRA